MFKVVSITLLLGIVGVQKACAQKNTVPKQSSCFYILEKYSEPWKLDSVGKNGLRELIATEFLGKCKFVGLKWEKISDILGKPNHSFLLGDSTYRYRLNHYDDDIKSVGTKLLEIDVNKNGTIVRFSIYDVDG